MTLITLPTSGVKSITWTEPQRTQFVMRSPWSTQRKVASTDIWTRWKAQVEIAPRTEAAQLAWSTFFALARDKGNSFNLAAVESDQHAAWSAFTYNAGVHTLYSLAASGMPINATPMTAGQKISFGGLLYTLTADCTTNGAGQGRLSFVPRLGGDPTTIPDTSLITTIRPYAAMAITSDTTGWSVSPGRIYQPFTFECEEAV